MTWLADHALCIQVYPRRPFLSDAFGQAIWHPRRVAELDKLMVPDDFPCELALMLGYLHSVHMCYNALTLQLP